MHATSPPSRRRGLKFFLPPLLRWYSVASFAEAWIEILYLLWMGKRKWVASFAEAWIEISLSSFNFSPKLSPPSRRRGLKLQEQRVCDYWRCRLLRGGVDWNKREWWRCRLSFDKSPPSRRRGLKFYFLPVDCAVVYRRLLRGGVDWNIAC